MKKFTLAVPVIISCICFLFVCCKKEQADPANPTNPTDTTHTDTTHSTDLKAVFTLSGLDCPIIIMDSNYYVGESIDSTDSIQIKVDVSKIGTWSFNGDTINGIYFKGTGTLSDTGQQYISIHPGGTPVSPGNTIFIFKTDSSQINLFVSVIEKDIVTEVVPIDTPYYKVTINNIDYKVTGSSDDPSKLPGGWATTGDSISVGAGVGPSVYPYPPGTGLLSIQKNYIGTDIANISENEFKNYFRPGASPMSIYDCDKTSRGVIIFWNDTNQYWSSYSGDDQQGSYFKIVGESDGHDSIGRYYVKVKIRFKCKIYLYPSKQMQELTNGEMVAYFFKPE